MLDAKKASPEWVRYREGLRVTLLEIGCSAADVDPVLERIEPVFEKHRTTLDVTVPDPESAQQVEDAFWSLFTGLMLEVMLREAKIIKLTALVPRQQRRKWFLR